MTNETTAGPVTLINVFEVEPEKLTSFLAAWRDRAELMSKRPGFRSLQLHRALSEDARFQVINVAVWESAEALRAATDRQDWREKAFSASEDLGFTANPALYRVELEMTAP